MLPGAAEPESSGWPDWIAPPAPGLDTDGLAADAPAPDAAGTGVVISAGLTTTMTGADGLASEPSGETTRTTNVCGPSAICGSITRQVPSGPTTISATSVSPS